MKKITFLFLVLFAFCWQTNAQIFIEENLDSGFPTGWSQFSYFASTNTSYLCEGTGNIADNMYSSASNDGVLTSPNFAGISNGTDTNVTFEWLSTPYQTNPIDYIIHVEYSTDDATTWNSVTSFPVTTTTPCTTYSETIPAASLPTSSDFKFRIRGEWQSGDSYFYLDNIYITQVISCPQPSALTATNIATTSADLGWTENGTSALYNVEVVDAGTAATGSATDTGVANGFTKTGLAAATDYEFYVQADCSGDISAWAGPFAFTTLCDVFTPEYNADMSVNVPNCWDEADSGDAASGPANLGAGTWYASNHNGTPSNAINLWQGYRSDWIISPVFDLSAAAPSELKVYVALTNSSNSGSGEQMGSDDEVSLLMTTDGGTTWTALQSWAQGTEPTEVGGEVTYDLTAVTGNVQFAFLGSEGTVDDSEDVYFHVSKFQVRETPSCIEPSTLTATNVTATSADLGWTLGGSETSWNVEVVDAGTAATGNATDSGVANGFTKPGLTAATDYEFYVQADCGGDVSAWVGPYMFTTLCNPVSTFPWTEDFESITTPDLPVCWMENNNNADGDFWKTYGTYGVGSSNAAGLYTDFNSGSNDDYLILPQFTLTGNERLKYSVRARSSGEPNDYKVVLSTTTSSASDFTTDLKALTVVSSTTHAEEIIDLSAYTGNVYIAIHVPSGGLDGWYIYFDDFTVEAIPSCVEPSTLTATNVTATSADLGWTENGTASLYNVEVVEAGTAATGTATDTGVANGFTKMPLNPSTDYEFYVQADCGSGVSAWAGPFAFSTPCAPESTDYTADMSANVPDACWSEAGSGEVAAGPSGLGASSWKAGRAFTDANANVISSNVMNLYQSNVAREWLISPVFNLDAIGASGLLVKVAVTDYLGSGTSSATDTDTMDSDDEVQLVMTTDNGTTWTNVTTWNAGNQPDVTGTDYILDLSAMTGSVQFAFFASDGTSSGQDYDFHVGHFEVSSAVLSTTTFDNEAEFTYYPNPVKNTLTLNAQSTIDNVTMYNMLGQVVFNAKPNTVDSELDMSNLKSGAYFVKVTIANNTKTIKVIKQ